MKRLFLFLWALGPCANIVAMNNADELASRMRLLQLLSNACHDTTATTCNGAAAGTSAIEEKSPKAAKDLHALPKKFEGFEKPSTDTLYALVCWIQNVKNLDSPQAQKQTEKLKKALVAHRCNQHWTAFWATYANSIPTLLIQEKAMQNLDKTIFERIKRLDTKLLDALILHLGCDATVAEVMRTLDSYVEPAAIVDESLKEESRALHPSEITPERGDGTVYTPPRLTNLKQYISPSQRRTVETRLEAVEDGKSLHSPFKTRTAFQAAANKQLDEETTNKIFQLKDHETIRLNDFLFAERVAKELLDAAKHNPQLAGKEASNVMAPIDLGHLTPFAAIIHAIAHGTYYALGKIHADTGAIQLDILCLANVTKSVLFSPGKIADIKPATKAAHCFGICFGNTSDHPYRPRKIYHALLNATAKTIEHKDILGAISQDDGYWTTDELHDNFIFVFSPTGINKFLRLATLKRIGERARDIVSTYLNLAKSASTAVAVTASAIDTGL